ncbi:MAG: EamA family transporter [Thermodesulfobacteriota bacterium]
MNTHGNGSGSSFTGYLSVAAAAVMWASSGTVGKVLMSGGITPSDLVQVRVTLASVLMGVLFALVRRDLLRIRVGDMAYFVLLGGLVMASVQLFYFYSISRIQVAAAILIQYQAPIFVAIYSVCFWGERFTRPKLAALLLTIGGCYLVTGAYELTLERMDLPGIGGALLSAFFLAAYTLLGERGMQKYPPWTVTFYSMVFAAMSWHMVHRPFGYVTAGYSASQWGLILYVSVIGTVLPFGLFLVGVNYIRSTRAIITATLEPISAAVIAFLVLGEHLANLQILGTAMVVTAIVLLQLHREREELAPEAIRTRPTA